MGIDVTLGREVLLDGAQSVKSPLTIFLALHQNTFDLAVLVDLSEVSVWVIGVLLQVVVVVLAEAHLIFKSRAIFYEPFKFTFFYFFVVESNSFNFFYFKQCEFIRDYFKIENEPIRKKKKKYLLFSEGVPS